jgi:hypothetical protein
MYVYLLIWNYFYQPNPHHRKKMHVLLKDHSPLQNSKTWEQINWLNTCITHCQVFYKLYLIWWFWSLYYSSLWVTKKACDVLSSNMAITYVMFILRDLQTQTNTNSQTCIKRSPLGQRKNCCIRQVTS